MAADLTATGSSVQMAVGGVSISFDEAVQVVHPRPSYIMNLDTGSGGGGGPVSTRPSSGFLYPRGDQ